MPPENYQNAFQDPAVSNGIKKTTGKIVTPAVFLAIIVLAIVIFSYIRSGSNTWPRQLTDQEKIDFMGSLPVDPNSPNKDLDYSGKVELMNSLEATVSTYYGLSEAKKLKLLEER